MLRLGLSGRYPHLDRGRLLLLLAGVLYVLSPVDLVPEILVPLLGLGDDALVVAWLVGTVLADTDAFLQWEAQQTRTVAGEVVG
jgi:uncharacterized membrane protein YkvA (DUF1232 family)